MRSDQIRWNVPAPCPLISVAVTRTFAALVVSLTTFPASVYAQQVDSTVTDSIAGTPTCNICLHAPRPGLDFTADGTVQDSTRRRAIEYSDAYGTRLTIHRIGSYVELPLFATEYILGQKLLTEETAGPLPRGSSLKSAHSLVAGGLGALFAINTVTGLWNLIEARHDPAGRTRRWIHSLMMLAADGGFFWTASVAGQARRTLVGADTHRNIAIGSMGIATAATLMMWLWKD
jgi:hypothetical protein